MNHGFLRHGADLVFSLPLINSGWEKPWVEQIIDRVMKGMLRTTEERTQGVVS